MVVAVGAIVGSFLLAQAADVTPTPKPKSSAVKKKTPSPTPARKTSKTSAAKKKATPAKKKKTKTGAKKKSTPAEESPSPKKSPTPAKTAADETPSPSPSATAAPIRALPAQAGVPQVNVEKSGLLEEQGYEPPPTPAPRRGWWFFSRPEATYSYLTRSVRSEIDRAPVLRRRWQFIIVHNSGTRQGSARIFDYYHRHVRRMQNGLAYQFVIGGHVHSDYLNNIALGICLVGDFNRGQPTRRQLEACEELINYLRKRCGKTANDRNIAVRPHREVNPPRWATDCPGDDFPYSWFRRFE